MAEKQNQEAKSATDYRAQRLDKLAQLKQLGVDPYASGFTPDARAAELDTKYKDLAAGTETQDGVKVAGRIRALRNSGMFIDLHDATGKIQVFCHKDNLAPAAMAILKLLDLGDLIGVEGLVRRTPRGELTVNARGLTVLAKALLPLPEKFHGLTDVETRYRQRYLDLIMSDESRQTLRRRSQIIAVMRRLLIERGFLEVETPMLH
ncbi:MAG: lysine--tRNA ligase, partial [Alphaproteobacteria bacterium]|nr:lysine--tRNA ligase [Alphaproteobacteria bacterium]